MPCHLLQTCRKFDVENFLKQMAGHVFKQIDYIVLLDKTHLTVYLSELRLAVGTQILIAETLGNLEITVEPLTMSNCLSVCGLCGNA